MPNHLSVLTLVLLNKFSTALLNESTPLHHENPCCLARIFFFKTILCLSAVFSWIYRAENLCNQFIHRQKLLPQFRRLSACYPSGDVLFSCSKRVDLGYFSQNSRTLCVPNHLSVLTASKERCKRLHLQISRAADIDGGCTHRVQFCKANDCANNQTAIVDDCLLRSDNSADCLLAIVIAIFALER